MEAWELNSQLIAKPNQNKSLLLIALLCILFLFVSVIFISCGKNEQIVGQWQMTKVLVGDKEYDAATFLDPTNQTDGSFVIQFYGDNTLIATGSLGTMKGASDGEWKKVSENAFLITIDNQERRVKLVENLLFMNIEIEDATMVIVFERE
jgi:hypothetical protein